MRILYNAIPSGGTIGISVRFNNDSANNYAVRVSQDGSADGTAASIGYFDNHGALAAVFQTGEIAVTNIASQEKLIFGHGESAGTSGPTGIPNRRIGVSKWANSSTQITRVDITSTAGTGVFAIGTEIVVLGHD